MTDTTETGPARKGSTERCANAGCGHTKRDHSGRRDHTTKHPSIPLRPWCHACEEPCLYEPPAVSAAVVPAADRAALRDRIAAAVHPLLMDTLPKPIAAVRADEVADAVLSVLPAPADRAAEEHRLALSDALGLGTGTPWDAIHDRVTELGLPPIDQDPVARRLGLLDEYRAKILTEAADAVFALDYDEMVGEEGDENLGSMREAWDLGTIHADKLLRRLAVESAVVDRVAAETPPAETDAVLLALVRDFLDPDLCQFDHHGYCQAHAAGFGGEPMSCPHRRAREVLAEIDSEQPGPAVEAQPGKDTETPQPKEA